MKSIKSWPTKILYSCWYPLAVPIFWHQAEIRSKAMTLRLVTAWNQFLIGRTWSVSRVPRVLRCRITWMGRGIGPSAGYRLETRYWLAQSNYLQAYRELALDDLNLTQETYSYNPFINLILVKTSLFSLVHKVMIIYVKVIKVITTFSLLITEQL